MYIFNMYIYSCDMFKCRNTTSTRIIVCIMSMNY